MNHEILKKNIYIQICIYIYTNGGKKEKKSGGKIMNTQIPLT